MQACQLRPRDAAAIALGAAALLGAILWLARGPGDLESRLRVAWLTGVVGLALVAVGMVRAAFHVSASQRPAASFWLICAGMGAFLFIWATTPFGWHYLPSDPRSQPENVLAFVFFLGFFGAAFLVAGCVMSVAALLKRWPPSAGDIPKR